MAEKEEILQDSQCPHLIVTFEPMTRMVQCCQCLLEIDPFDYLYDFWALFSKRSEQIMSVDGAVDKSFEDMVKLVFHLDWMIKTLDFQNQCAGLDSEESPEMREAKAVLARFKVRMARVDALHSHSKP